MPLTPEAISAIDNQLDLCDTTSITQAEIDYQNAIGANPVNECEYYSTTQSVLLERSKYDARVQTQLDTLAILAGHDGCTLTTETAETPAVNIPFFAGAIK